MVPLILASASPARAAMLAQVQVPFQIEPVRLDEASIRQAMVTAGSSPRDVADALAEGKARKASSRFPDKLVLGSDQVLDLNGMIFSKPETKEDALAQLCELGGQTHKLLSAAVLYEDAKPVWRHVGQVRLTMHSLTEAWLVAYIDRNWDSIQHSVGGYKIEEEGAQLFTRIEGDHFNIMGLPLLELLSYLTLKGTLPS